APRNIARHYTAEALVKRLLDLLRDLGAGAALTLALPTFVVILILGVQFRFDAPDAMPTDVDAAAISRQYAAALAAESASVWRQQARRAAPNGTVVHRPTDESSGAARVIDEALAGLQSAGQLPAFAQPIVIEAREAGGLIATTTDATAYPGVPTRFVSLPATPNDACVVSLRVRFTGDDQAAMQRAQYVADAGPCVFVSAFGLPGTAIRAWLDSTEWIAATGWLVPTVREPVQRAKRFPERSVAATLRVFDALDPWRGAARFDAAPLLSCIGGRDTGCVDAAMMPQRSRLPDVARPAFGVLRLPIWRTYEVLPEVGADGELYNGDHQIFAADLLPTLLRELGPVRFQRVWQSSLPLPESYARETGEPFAAWARRYLHVPEHAVQPPRGADVNAASLWWITGAVLLSVGVVALGYRRTQLG
ncbi:MAG: hypothetical protein SFW08_10010, partial [Gemmatimonadaceae bacterium]|nr:hypothetical protein [Gemmatimonadaceae bacterium]